MPEKKLCQSVRILCAQMIIFVSVKVLMEEIVNKVKDSGLIQLDLAKYKPTLELVGIDLALQLWQGLILKEKDFRAWIKEHDWSHYSGKAVFIYCDADAIIPVWAYMLVTSKLVEQNTPCIVGSKLELQKQLIKASIESEDVSSYQDERIIVKGCSDIASPEFAMTCFIQHFQPVAKSIMFGEPCSTVPVFKRRI